MANKESDLVKKSFYEIPISESELRDIIALAESLRQYDISRNDIKRLPSYDTHASFTLSTALDIGKQVGLDGYVEKAINSRYISNDVKISDLRAHQAVPTNSAVSRTYYNELRKILTNFPGDNISVDLDVSKAYIHIQKNSAAFRRSLFGKRMPINYKEDLANFRFNDYREEVVGTIHDPLILRICSPSLKKLKELFKWKQIIKHEYPIEIE
jgi:hypothetical protein